MRPRVIINGSVTSKNMNWDDMVIAPAKEGYFIQAFASADALIDDVGELILRDAFKEAQSFINEMKKLRGKTGFDGPAIFGVLKNKGVISNELHSKIILFKQKRNSVLHDVEAEYSLVKYSEQTWPKTQSEFDNQTKIAAMGSLGNALAIFTSLIEVLKKRKLLEGNT